MALVWSGFYESFLLTICWMCRLSGVGIGLLHGISEMDRGEHSHLGAKVRRRSEAGAGLRGWPEGIMSAFEIF